MTSDSRAPGDGRAPSAAVADHARTTVAILADDLIWSSRLFEAVRGAGAQPIRALRAPDLDRAIENGARFALIDLTAHGYDGIEAIRSATRRGARVRALAHHGDIELRKAALAAGAERVLAYRKLFEDGPAVVRAWVSAGDDASEVDAAEDDAADGDDGDGSEAHAAEADVAELGRP